MKTVKEYSLENFIRLCDCMDTDKFDGCVVSRGCMHAGYDLPLFRLRECFMLLCISGEIHVELDNESHVLSSRSLLVCPANNAVRMDCHRKADFICVIPTSDYLGRNYSYWKQILPLIMETGIQRRYIISLTESESVRYEHMAGCVMDYMHCDVRHEWVKETLSSGMRTLLCAIFGKLEAATGYGEGKRNTKSLSRSEEYFSRFMKLLSIHYRHERKVDFYASELCVTPKYLSSMVKEASGKTPGRWIDEVVMEEIHYLLKNSNISIKEIAYQLNFANVSFFGKFVKRYIGVSPRRYRVCDMTLNPVAGRGTAALG